MNALSLQKYGNYFVDGLRKELLALERRRIYTKCCLKVEVILSDPPWFSCWISFALIYSVECTAESLSLFYLIFFSTKSSLMQLKPYLTKNLLVDIKKLVLHWITIRIFKLWRCLI